MKTKQLFLIAFSSLTMIGYAQETSQKYILQGNIDGIPDNTCVQLIPLSHDKEQPIAETVVKNGTFTFTGQIKEPRAVRLIVKDAYGSRKLILENTLIKVNGNVTPKQNNGKTSYDFNSLAVSGSSLNARYDSLMQIRVYSDSLYNAFRRKYASFDSALQKAYETKDINKVKELQQSDIAKAKSLEDHILYQTTDSLFRKTVMDNKDSFWGPLMIISQTFYLDDKIKPLYEALSTQAKMSYYGKMVRNELYPAGSIGTEVPGFTVKDKNGQEITLEALCKNKKYILIDFWASWCGPCRKEIPNLKKLYQQYHDKGFDIISISIDKKKTDWEKASEEESIPWNNFLDETKVAELYKVKLIPRLYLIDSNGILISENLHGNDLINKIQELFK